VSTPTALAFLAGFFVGIVAFALTGLRSRPRPDATMCCGCGNAPCDEFHAEGASEQTYCERCHHHWTCHDTEYDRP
jgi:hypothetical protein